MLSLDDVLDDMLVLEDGLVDDDMLVLEDVLLDELLDEHSNGMSSTDGQSSIQQGSSTAFSTNTA